MHGTVQFDGTTSESFEIKNRVKQGCVLDPTLFGILFSVLLRYSFLADMEGIYLHTRTDGKLYNLSRLRAKRKVRRVLIRELLHADDAALVTHIEDWLQKLIDRLSHACTMLSLYRQCQENRRDGTRCHNPAPDCTKQYSAGSRQQIQLSLVDSDEQLVSR